MSERSDRFTERARKALAFAEQEARRLNHDAIDTEHLLLGLIREGEGLGAKILAGLGVEIAQVREKVATLVGPGAQPIADQLRLGLTPRAKQAIEHAWEEARKLQHQYVGTEHLLLGLIRRDGRAEKPISATVLEGLGLDLDQVRQEVIRVCTSVASRPGLRPQAAVDYLRGLLGTPVKPEPREHVVTCRVDDRTLTALDALVETGVHATRSEAAARLIEAGLEANRPLMEKVFAAVEEIHRIREQTQVLAQAWKPEQAGGAPTGDTVSESGRTDGENQPSRANGG